METGRKSVFKTSINMVPFIALSFSMAAFAIVVILLMISINTLKSDNAKLTAQMDTLNEALMTVQNASVMNESQEDTLTADIQSVKTRMDAIEALKSQMEQAQTAEGNPGLAVASFDLQYIANPNYAYQTYTGTGTVSAADTKDSFLVLLQKTLKSGGAPTTKKLDYMLVLVVGGSGTFYTDDSAEGTVEKPEYEFAIVGSVRIAAGAQAGK